MRIPFFRKKKENRDHWPVPNILLRRPLKAQVRVLVNEGVWRRNLLLVSLSHIIRKNPSYFTDLPKVAFQFSEKLPPPGGYATIYCEHGWLPRDHYQISSLGVNQRHHVVPLLAGNPEAPSADVVARNEEKLEAVRKGFRDLKAPDDLCREPFFLFALQMTNDLNLHRSGLRLAELADRKNIESHFKESVSAMMEEAAPGTRIIFLQHPSETCGEIPALRPGHVYVPRSANIRALDLAVSPACRGVITINSNAMNEALAFGLPVFQLGDFLTKAFPNPYFPYDLQGFLTGPEACLAASHRDAYLGVLLENQRNLRDLEDPAVLRGMIVEEISRKK